MCIANTESKHRLAANIRVVLYRNREQITILFEVKMRVYILTKAAMVKESDEPHETDP